MFGKPIRLNWAAVWTQVKQNYLDHFAFIIQLLTMACELQPLCPHSLLLFLVIALDSVCSCLPSNPWIFYTCCHLRAFAHAIPSVWNTLLLHLYLAVSRSQLSHPFWERPPLTLLAKFAPSPLPYSILFICFRNYLLSFGMSSSVEYKFHVIFFVHHNIPSA